MKKMNLLNGCWMLQSWRCYPVADSCTGWGSRGADSFRILAEELLLTVGAGYVTVSQRWSSRWMHIVGRTVGSVFRKVIAGCGVRMVRVVLHVRRLHCWNGSCWNTGEAGMLCGQGFLRSTVGRWICCMAAVIKTTCCYVTDMSRFIRSRFLLDWAPRSYLFHWGRVVHWVGRSSVLC